MPSSDRRTSTTSMEKEFGVKRIILTSSDGSLSGAMNANVGSTGLITWQASGHFKLPLDGKWQRSKLLRAPGFDLILKSETGTLRSIKRSELGRWFEMPLDTGLSILIGLMGFSLKHLLGSHKAPSPVSRPGPRSGSRSSAPGRRSCSRSTTPSSSKSRSASTTRSTGSTSKTPLKSRSRSRRTQE